MKRRILSIILTLTMIASLFAGLSVTAAAVDAPAGGSYVIAANVNGTYYAMSASFASKIESKVVTVTDGKVSLAAAEGYTVTLAASTNGYTISNGEAYLAYNSSTNFKTVTEIDNSALWTVSDGVLGSYRFANVKTATRGIAFRAGTYNQFGAYALSNVTENGTEYYDLELLPIDDDTVWTWDGNPGANGYHTEVNQNNKTRSVACTPGEGVIDPAPTCIATGTESFYCTVCSAFISSNELPLAPHNYVNGICTVCGAEEPVLESFVLADSIRAGDQIIFVDQSGAKAAGPLGGSGSGTYLTAVDAVIGDGVAASEDALVFTVEEGANPGTFNFKTNDTWLTANKAATSNNYLYLVDETDTHEELDWNVTFADGLAAVSYCSSTAASGRYLRYNVNNNSPRFSGYVSSSASIRNVSIYKLATAEDLVDVYFVDQDDNANAFVYAFGSNAENAPFPGEQITALGVDENGDNYYKLTLDRNVYTNVIFSGGASDSQTANLGLGTGAHIVYYVNGHTGYEGQDVWPGPGTVTPPTCTEPGCTTFVGLLTGAVHQSNVTDPIGHAWGAWTFNGDNTHSRVCANDETHIENEVCVDEDEDGFCDVCEGELISIEGIVADGAYVIAAKVGSAYYALPAAMTANNPNGELITVVDGMVSAADAKGRIFNLNFQLDGSYTIDNGEKYLGGGSSGTALCGLSMEEQLSDFFRWNVAAGEFGSYHITNAAVPTRGLFYQDNSSANPTTVYQRFGFYAVSNVNGETYFDVELLPVYVEADSTEEIDVWFVDETDQTSAYAFYFNAEGSGDSEDTMEDLQYPGKALNPIGIEKGGHKYYKITLSTDEYTHVIFNNGQTGGVSSGNQTTDLEFKADAMTNPLNPDANRYVVYYITRNGAEMNASVGTDVWPAPGVVTEPSCTEGGYTTYTGLITGEERVENQVAALGHDYEAVVTTEATCTETGVTTYTCSRCGDSYTEEIPALGHDWGEWEVTTAPSCMDGGIQTRSCARCDETETEQIDPLGHLPGEPVQENYVEPAVGVEGGYDTVVCCQRCGEELSREHTVLPALPNPEPIETTALRIYSSISVGTDMVVTWTARKTDVASYERFWIEVVKHAPDGDETYLYGAEQAEALNEGSSSWSCDFKHVFAKEMGVEIEARVYAEDANGQIYRSPAKTTSIRDYLGGRLTAANNPVSQRVLAADMLNYGAAAQLYMGYDTEHLVNEELTADQLAKLDEYETKELPVVEKTNSNYRPEGQSNVLFNSVSLDNEVILSLTVRAAEGSDVKVLMKDHESGTVLETLDAAWTGSNYVVNYSGIGADKMRVAYDFVAQIDGAETGNVRTWSVEGYVGELRSGNNQLRTNVANALLTYGDSAAAYFAAQ